MVLENVLNVVRGVDCVCVLCVCCAVCRGMFWGSFLSTFLKRFNKDNEEPVLTYEREAGYF